MSEAWSTGRPPASGWYNATRGDDVVVQRYWHDERAVWSAPWYPEQSDDARERAKAGLSAPSGEMMRWRALPTEPYLPDDSTKPTNPKDAIGVRKAPLSVVPMNVIAELGVAMLEGSAKYGRHNYRGVGVRASVYFDATMRHLIDYWERADIDPDSGISHITKAIASLTVLRDAQMQGKCEDDRPPCSAEFYPELNAKAAALIDKHAGKDPKHWTRADVGGAA